MKKLRQLEQKTDPFEVRQRSLADIMLITMPIVMTLPDSFERETESMASAIAHANRLGPDFVIVCGDLTNVPGHAGWIAEFKRIAAQLDRDILCLLTIGYGGRIADFSRSLGLRL